MNFIPRDRWLVLILVTLAGTIPAFAQHNEYSAGSGKNGRVVNTFTGTGTTGTDPFTVRDHWEIQWVCDGRVGIGVLDSNHKVVVSGYASNAAMTIAAPGTYTLQINGPAIVKRAEDKDAPPGKPGDNSLKSKIVTRPPLYWNVVVQNRVDDARAPATSLPGSAPTKAETTDPTPAVVVISGDNRQGTGFLIKTPEGSFVLTTTQVIANNPHLVVTTSSGAPVTVLSAQCAADRDLARLAVKDAGLPFLDLAADVSKIAAVGDDISTPINSQSGAAILSVTGKVLGIGAQRVDFTNPIAKGNGGGPIFHVKSGKVIGVVTEEQKTEVTGDIDQATYAARISPPAGPKLYYGLRCDTVASWLPVDWKRLDIEEAFLDQFHQRSRSLDAYLNAPERNPAGPGGEAVADLQASADAKIYSRDAVIMKAQADYHQQASGADMAQKNEALKILLFALQGAATADLDQIQNRSNFYPFNQDRAKSEMIYRKALQAELDAIAANPNRLTSLPRNTAN